MEEEMIFKLIGTMGFPVIACAWMAIIGKRAIDNLTTSIDNLAKAFSDQSPRLDRLEIKVDHLIDKVDAIKVHQID